MIGEPQREFYGNQFGNTFPLFVHYDVPLWIPEVGGPIDPNNEAHDLIMSVFGGMSKGERNPTPGTLGNYPGLGACRSWVLVSV